MQYTDPRKRGYRNGGLASFAETLARKTCHDFGIDVESLTWIEHRRGDVVFGERYDRVRFKFENKELVSPEGESISKEEIENIIQLEGTHEQAG